MNHVNFEAAKKMLIFDEGMKLSPYQCSEGHQTIGIGHLLSGDIGLDAALAIFAHDLTKAENGARGIFPEFDSFSTPRQLALINLTFNLGAAGLRAFKKFVAAMKAANFSLAAAEILNSKYAAQVPKRAARIAAMIENDRLPKEYSQS